MNRKILLVLVFLCPWLGASAQEGLEATNPNYVIQPSDVLSLKVFQEPDLDQEFRVPQNGRFHFPLIGNVDLKGKTVEEAEDLLRELYDRDYLVNPQINLLVLEYTQRRVNVLGNVNQPGAVVFPPEEEMNVVDAISRAGGFTRLARTSAVTLTRTTEDGQIEQYQIDVGDLMTGGDASLWKLEKGDTIFVPERRI